MKQLYFLLSVCFVVSNIAEAQNVGIGTSTPSARLHIQTPNLAINEASFRVQPLGGGSSNTSHFSLIDMWSTFDNYSADQLPRRTVSLKAGFSGGTWGNEYLSFRVGGSNDVAIEPTERMRILANGNVIINSLGTGYVKTSSGTLSSSATVPWADISGAPAFLTSYTETDPQVGANTTSYVPRWNGSALVSGVIQDNGTNVGISKAADATYNLDVNGSLRISANNANGGGLQLADDGDIVDNNDGFATHRFSYGLRITNANKGGSTVVQIANGASGSGNTYFNAGNNFGINTTNPSNRLHVGASEGQGIDIGLPDDAMGFNGGSTSIRFYGYRDVVSNAIGAKISAERTDRCCGWLSQGTELVFYTNAGLTTSNADNSIERVRIKDDGTLEAKAGFKTERHIRFYKRSRGNGQGGIDDLGNYDMCFLTGTSFRNSDSVSDEDDDYQCNVYSLDINGSADYNEGENEDFSNNFGWNSRPYWRLYSECYQDCSNTTCTATCINFDY